jgi:hypothetical protein
MLSKNTQTHSVFSYISKFDNSHLHFKKLSDPSHQIISKVKSQSKKGSCFYNHETGFTLNFVKLLFLGYHHFLSFKALI